jgi:hypothetical protein
MIEVCAGCGNDLEKRDCGCPAGTSLCINPALDLDIKSELKLALNSGNESLVPDIIVAHVRRTI